MARNLKADLLSDKIIKILKKFMIFRDLSDGEIRELLAMDTAYDSKIAKLCQYDPGETVIREGEFDCWTFWVVKGAFEVVQNDETLIVFSKPGQIFGEMSVLEGLPRTATVISKSPGVCLCIDMSVTERIRNHRIRETITEGFYKVILDRLGRTKGMMMAEKKRIENKYADLVDFEDRIRKRSKKK